MKQLNTATGARIAYGVNSALNVIVLFSIEGSVNNSPGHCRGGSLRGCKRLNSLHFNLLPCLTGARISQQSADAMG